MDRVLVERSSSKKKQNILLVTITTYNFAHVQLGLYNLKAYFLNKINLNRKLNQFNLILEVINPKKIKNRKDNDFYPIFSEKEVQEIANKLIKKKPVIIGFSCFMWNMDYLLSIAKIIKKQSPHIKIVFGGPEISYKAKEIMKKNKCIDIVAINDGEESFYEIIQCHQLDNNKLEDVKGILFRKGNEIITTPHRITELSTLPSPYLTNLIDLNDKRKEYIIETLRGCPFRCAYCSYHLGAYERVRYFPLKRVFNELKLLFAHNVQHIIITDDNFNIDESRAIEVLKNVIKHRKDTIIDAYLNIYIRKLGTHFISLLSQVNIFFAIGIQSINPDTLKRINRPSRMALLEENLSLLNSNQIKYEIQFIIGLPGDTYDDFIKNIEWGLRFHPYRISFFLLSVINGTEIFERHKEYGITYKKSPPYTIIKTPTLAPKKIKQALKIFDALNLLYNLGLLRKTLIYMNEHFGIEYYYVLSEWTKLFSTNKTTNKQLYSLLTSFISKILMSRNIPLSNNYEIFTYINEDFALYCKKYIK